MRRDSPVQDNSVLRLWFRLSALAFRLSEHPTFWIRSPEAESRKPGVCYHPIR